MDSELIDELSEVETIAVNLSIRENLDLKARNDGRRRRKLRGVGSIRLPSEIIRRAEAHWCEAEVISRPTPRRPPNS